MSNPIRAFVLPLLFLIASPAVAAAPPVPEAAPITVIVTRHAERADAGDARDPALSEAGAARARALADALGGAGIGTILTTQYRRTRATAEPLAAATGVEITVVEAGAAIGEHIAAIRAAVLAQPPGSVVLVVGHSNTTPLIVRELTGLTVPDMPDSEYGTLYIATIGGGMPAKVIRASY